MSTRDTLMAAMRVTANIKPVPVPTVEWGVVYVRAVSVADVEQPADGQVPAELIVDGKKRNLARGAAKVICDEAGVLVFDSNNAEDVELLAAQPWKLLQKVLAASDNFNATSKEGVDAAKNA